METQHIDYRSVAFDLIREGDIWAIRSVNVPSGMTDVMIPEKVDGRIVGRVAWQCSPFKGNLNLRKIILPAGSHYSVSAGEFAGCVNLTCFEVCAGHPYHSANEGMLFDDRMRVLVAMPSANGVVELPPVERICDCAFKDCSKLQEVAFGRGLLKIGSNVFENCSSINGIVIPQGVRTLGNRVFCGCSSLKSVELPSGCQFGFEMFKNCSSSIIMRMHGSTETPDMTGYIGNVTVTRI